MVEDPEEGKNHFSPLDNTLSRRACHKETLLPSRGPGEDQTRECCAVLRSANERICP